MLMETPMHPSVIALPREVLKRGGDRAAFNADKICSAIERAGAATGEFGADMKVASVNDGPVTLLFDTDTL